MVHADKRPLKVFLCHASGDKPPVRDLYKRLTAEGVDAWLDKERLLPGQDWRLEIPKAVREADVVVVCLSKKSITKEGYVQKEIKFALDIAEEKPEGTIFLIPARLEDCSVPDRLNRWQWVDLYEEDGFVRLLRSLKLRADAVDATVEPTSYIDSEKETDHKLEQLYIEGLAAFYTEDWDKACQRFQSILSERPNHKNASEKLEEAKRQRDLAKLYEQAIVAVRSEDWGAAIRILEEISQMSADYKDASQLLRNARKQIQLNELYTEAKTLHTAQKWEAVVRVFDQISSIDSGYEDVDGLLSSAQKELAEFQRMAKLEEKYSQALREMDEGNWYEARKLLEQAQKSQAGYLETEKLLRIVDNEIVKEEEKPKHNDEINTLFEEAHGLFRSKKWLNTLLRRIQLLSASSLHKLKNLKLTKRTMVVIIILIVALGVIPYIGSIYEGGLFQLIRATKTFVPNILETATGIPITIQKTDEITNDQQSNKSRPWIDGSILVNIPQGEFIIGDEGSDNFEHPVMLDEFWIYRTEVTNMMYANCVAAGVCVPPPLEDYMSPFHSNEPVVNVTWEQAETYCTWLQARLPTEAEWEKAARGPNGNIYPWGNNPPECDLLNFDNCTGIPSFVTDFPDGKSYYGVFDMAGNVFEWTADWYVENYYESITLGNTPTSQGEYRTVRSSGFLSGEQDIGLTNRFFLSPEEKRVDLGFRCAVDNPDHYPLNCTIPASVQGGQSDNLLVECTQPAVEIVSSLCINNNKLVNIDIPENNDGYQVVSFIGEHEIEDLVCSESKEYANDINEIRVTCNWSPEETSVNVCRLCQISGTAEDNLCNGEYEFNPETNLCNYVGQSLNASCPQGFALNSELGCCISPLEGYDMSTNIRNCYSEKIPEQTFVCVEIRPTKSNKDQPGETCNYYCSDAYTQQQCEVAGGVCTDLPGPCYLPPLCP